MIPIGSSVRISQAGDFTQPSEVVASFCYQEKHEQNPIKTMTQGSATRFRSARRSAQRDRLQSPRGGSPTSGKVSIGTLGFIAEPRS
jgi:hypothetical protein